MNKNKSIFDLPGKTMRFDIPLQARFGTEFISLLLALMTFLCILTGCLNLSLNSMARNWTDGLADTVTIEIPAPQSTPQKLDILVKNLNAIENVSNAKLLNKKELQSLIEPWLGKNNQALDDLPVPSLINLKLQKRDAATISKINQTVMTAIPEARVDAHDLWLSDILKLSEGLQLGGAFLIIVIGFVTAITVGGAVRSRMAIHHSELELLHLMGASDIYITRQFQKYILLLSGKGILLGFVFSVLILAAAYEFSFRLPTTMPRFDLEFSHFIIVPLICFLLLGISVFAAQRTVTNVLKEMP